MIQRHVGVHEDLLIGREPATAHIQINLVAADVSRLKHPNIHSIERESGNRWTLDVTRIRRACGQVKLPEQRPKLCFQRMQFWIARHSRTGERPILRVLDQFGNARVVNDVETHFTERLLSPLFLAQDMVVGLVLKAMRTEQFPDMLAQKLHAMPLIATAPQPHPDQMNVIGHQTVGRAK